jgi:hypothetical protein
MPTPNGTTTAYAAATDLVNYRDWRQMADWVSTNDVRGTQPDFESNPIVATHLLMNSGYVEAACLKGGRYQLSDLQALTGASQQLLVCLVCWLTIGSLSRFKTRTRDEKMPEVERAEGMLQALAAGERVFALEEVSVDAFQAKAQDMAPPNSEFEERRISIEAERMFGDRRS